mgnify:CR=1 FL=1
MRPKHIIIDARNRRSSTGRYTDRLVEHLQDIDHDNHYTVLVAPGDNWQPKNKNFAATPSRFAQFSFNPLDQIAFSWQLYRLHPDLVHFTMTQQPLFYFGKIVTTTHDLTMLRFARAGRLPRLVHALRMLAYSFLFWWSHRKSTRIIVPTNFVKQDLAKHSPFTKKKTVVTYEASDHLKKLEPKALKGARKPFIFHVGSPFPHKNIQRLIQAFEIVKESQPNLQLVLGGKKEHYYQELEAWAADSPVRKSILFYGFVPDAQMRWLHKNAEAYVLPSLSEGFAIPGLEAMVNECPLISSNATCMPEVFGKGAHYFDPFSVTDIARAIQEVLRDDNLKKKLVVAGKQQVKKYSWDKMAIETMAVYNEVLGVKS